jgi:hypothetical protein
MKLKLFYYLQSVAQSILVPRSHLGPMTRFLLSLWRLRVSWYGAPSLTRGWLCNLHVQLLLCLARVVTLGSKSRRTHGHILLSHLRLPQPGGPGPVFISPRNRVVQLYPGNWVPFLSPLTTRKATYGGGILTRLHTGLYYIYSSRSIAVVSIQPPKETNARNRTGVKGGRPVRMVKNFISICEPTV